MERETELQADGRNQTLARGTERGQSSRGRLHALTFGREREIRDTRKADLWKPYLKRNTESPISACGHTEDEGLVEPEMHGAGD